ncbi:hypothetical protein [Cyanobium sp. NS01]|nr:hypothetical protein [Cyanobium sp. NS01]QNI69718.1 hypothetical protein CyaNS01_00567 [Cyanobium sp. NS01]
MVNDLSVNNRFERIGGTRGRSFALRTGILDVNGAGVASFF